ncbi:hypothetical protein [Paenibacillus dauci]|uniref:hypothetical protein n=1 Tax=Paenibacillus dauci TaxID=1567106 RepID=UPI000619ED0F|nr:hypothetical protein [Paenibacillus dauci]
MEIDIQKLYKKYLELNIPNPFSPEQIHQRLTKTYYAQKVDLDRFSDLKEDMYAEFDKATGAYVFEDERGIQKLMQLNNNEDIDSDSVHAWVINSTQLGMSNLLTLEITIFYGINPENMSIGNLEFEEYLIMLYLAGYIQFENDTCINEIRELYKKGYYLRYFGVQNDSEKFLYDPKYV